MPSPPAASPLQQASQTPPTVPKARTAKMADKSWLSGNFFALNLNESDDDQ